MFDYGSIVYFEADGVLVRGTVTGRAGECYLCTPDGGGWPHVVPADFCLSQAVQSMRARVWENARIQDMLNRRHSRNGFVPKQALVFYADRAHSQYPQYAGHWSGDEWQVEVITHRVRTKAGIAFEPGDVALVKWERSLLGLGVGSTRVAYSIRNGVDTVL